MAVDAGDIVFKVLGNAEDLQRALKAAASYAQDTGKKMVQHIAGAAGIAQRAWSIASRSISADFADAANKASRAGNIIGQSAATGFRVAGAAATTAGVAITAGLGKSVSSAMEFSKSLGMLATLGVKDMPKLTASIKKVATTFGIDLVEAADAAYNMISSQVSEVDALKVLEMAAKGAAAGQTELTNAIDLGTNVALAFNTPLTDMIKTFDQAFIAADKGKTTFNALSTEISGIAPQFAAAGLKSDEMFSALAAITSIGTPTSEAVTLIANAIKGITKPQDAAAESARQYGIELSTTALQAQGLSGFLKNVVEATKGNQDALRALFPDQEAFRAMVMLTGNQLPIFNQAMEAMNSGVAKTDQAFKAMVANNPGFFFDQLKTSLQVLGVEIGTALLPMLKAFSETFTPIMRRINEWMAANPVLAQQIAQWAFALGLVLLAAGPLLFMLPSIIALFTGIATAFGLVLSAAISAWPLTLAVIFAAATGMFGSFDSIKERLATLWDNLPVKAAEMWNRLVQIISQKLVEAGLMTQEEADKMTLAISLNPEKIAAAWTQIRGYITEAIAMVKDAIDQEMTVVGAKIDEVTAKLYSMYEIILTVLGALTGAQAGLAFGPLGAAAGLGIGGLIGYGASGYGNAPPLSPEFDPYGGQAYSSGMKAKQLGNSTANVNINMGGVNVRNEQDAAMLSKVIAKQLRQEMRSMGYAT